jgi:AGCS family alanine or glycine:cation symporter
MWVTAAVGMATKYSSCSLALKYRTVHPDGTVSGGPMYYIERGLGWKWLAVIFALFAGIASMGIGCMVQANSVVDGVKNLLPEKMAARTVSETVPLLGNTPVFAIVLGLILAALVALVIIGGIRRIAHVAQFLVPVMSVFYVGGALIILSLNAASIPEAFGQIFRYAFTPLAAGGGIIGYVVQQTIRNGVARGIFSNESGLGSAPIAHAAAKTREMAREGFVAMMEPFIDTLVICTMTGLVILVSGQWMVHGADGELLYGPQGQGRPAKYVGHTDARGETIVIDRLKGEMVVVDADSETREPFLDENGQPIPIPTSSTLTISAFQSTLGQMGIWIVALGLALFAYSTMLTWSYYGDRSIGYLFGQRAVMPYRWLFCGFVFVGAVGGLETIWTVADILNACMAFPNLIALILLSGVVVRETRDYLRRMDEEHGRLRREK